MRKQSYILEEIKKELGIQYEEIDIYNNRDELTELYGLMIPVVEWQGEIVQYGKVDKEKLCQCIIKNNFLIIILLKNI